MRTYNHIGYDKNKEFMYRHANLENNTVYISSVFLPNFNKKEEALLRLLSNDEALRANRFHSSLDRQRYIISRGLLRMQLSVHTNTPAEKIQFSYGEYGKPYLSNNKLNLFFNISHSHEQAIYAFTLHAEVGVDIEKIDSICSESIAKQFFSTSEYESLCALHESAKQAAFYHIWSCKEALIKSVGAGLFIPLSSFSILLTKDKQIIFLNERLYHVERVLIDPLYASAIATTWINPAVVILQIESAN